MRGKEPQPLKRDWALIVAVAALVIATLTLFATVNAKQLATNITSYGPYFSWLTSPWLLAVSSGVLGSAATRWLDKKAAPRDQETIRLFRQYKSLKARDQLLTAERLDPESRDTKGELAEQLPVHDPRNEAKTTEAAFTHAIRPTPTIADLLYSSRQLKDLLFEAIYRPEHVERHLAVIEKDNPVWHDKETLRIRNLFVDAIRQGQSVRYENGSSGWGVAGKFTDGQNKRFQSMLAYRLKKMEDGLGAAGKALAGG